MKRETRITVTFTHPFQLKGIDRTLPPGDYTILTEEELTNDNASFPVYHRLSTVIFVSSKQYVEMFTIDPVDLKRHWTKMPHNLPECTASVWECSFVTSH